MRRLIDHFSRHPVRVVPMGFAAVALAGAALLTLPAAQAEPGGTRFVDALFTAVSAVSVTGLVTVDTPTHWSGFGEAVILGCMQLGGFGVMATAALLGMLASRRFRLRSRLMTQAELHSAVGIGEVKAVVATAVTVTVAMELAISVALGLRFRFTYGFGGGESAWLGVFHAVSAFNNAGFGLFSDSLTGYATDPWIILPLCAGTVVGGLGVPVLFELTRRGWGRRQWSLHTKATLVGSGALLAIGTVVLLAFEWGNPATLGRFAWHDRLLPAFFQSTALRTSGFNSVDIGALHGESLLVSMMLMFVGGGAASTAGGIKVTTFVVLLWVIWAEVRGERDVAAFRRRVPAQVVQEALSVALVYLGLNVLGVLLMQIFEPALSMEVVAFEVVSAAATVGQSTGVTAGLGDPSKWLLLCVMLTGRIGPVLFAASLAMRARKRLYRYPESRPLVG
jgi:trk system potassium uptake protein